MALSKPALLLLILCLLTPLCPSCGKLSPNYYSETCPRLLEIVQRTITDKQITSPSTAAASLRLFLHDCLPNGCDGSVLITSTPLNTSERDADINLSLPGDGFDVVVRIKTAVELECPGVVSCADILALATRDLVTMVGGPYYKLRLGRKDGLESSEKNVEGNLPRPTMPMSQIIDIFKSRGFTVQEMVALSGAHTVGFSHCKEFGSSIYNYSTSSRSDPFYNPRFAEALQKACDGYNKNPTLSVFNDIMTPNKFDNTYFQNLPKGLGILASDHKLYNDPRTRPYVETYARDQNLFFQAFGRAMEKLSLHKVKTGRHGNIRRRCDAFN